MIGQVTRPGEEMLTKASLKGRRKEAPRQVVTEQHVHTTGADINMWFLTTLRSLSGMW